MAFGLSKNDTMSSMDGADVIVAYTDSRQKGHAIDYYLGSKEQCTGRRGSCPDTQLPGGQDSVTLLNSAIVNGYTMITIKRPQVGLDEKYDQHVYSDGPQAVVWAVGPINDKQQVAYHGAKTRTQGDMFIDFARPPQWNCPQPAESDHMPSETGKITTEVPQTTTQKAVRGRKPTIQTKPIGPRYAAEVQSSSWSVPPIICPADRTLRAQIGPTGGKIGHKYISGNVGWGIAWYINGLPLPEITLERGTNYTFIVEGGDDPENSARSHPFYITDDKEGGFGSKTSAEKRGVKIYAGATRDRRGNILPSASGRLCEYKFPNDEVVDDFDTFNEFQENLELRCGRGSPGQLNFQPNWETPDTLYYQCFNHRFLGWKIHIVDSCDDVSAQDRELPQTTTTMKTTSRRVTTKKPVRGRNPTVQTKPIGPRYAAEVQSSSWSVPPINCPADRTLKAQIGPRGGKVNNQVMSGTDGWGIAWYINGLPLPEITLERGTTYTFIVEGGNDPENSARSHPFYITDDREGGFDSKTAAEKRGVKIYAGATKDRRGNILPSASGRLCEYKLPKDEVADDFHTFSEFQENLELRCERGTPGRLTFRPNWETPDTLYYQCFNHRFLGWKIHIVDSCEDASAEATIRHERNVTYESDFKRGSDKKNKLAGFGTNSTDIQKLLDDSQKELYYEPSSRFYFSSPTHSYSTAIPDIPHYNRLPSTVSKKYFRTTPVSGSHYYKSNTAYSRSSATTPTMEPFRIRDVVPSSSGLRGSGSLPSNVHKVSSTYESGLRGSSNTLSRGSNKPSSSGLKVGSSAFSGGQRGSSNPTSNGQKGSYSPTRNGHRGISSAQHSVQRGSSNPPRNEQRGSNSQSISGQRASTTYRLKIYPKNVPVNSTNTRQIMHYPLRTLPEANGKRPVHEQSYIPLVLKNTVVHHQSPKAPDAIPVLVKTIPGRRRISTAKQQKQKGIGTPHGRLPYPSGNDSYLPLLIPKSSKKKAVAIPLVVPEMRGDNLYILHQMLSLLNENPQNIVKLVGKTRVVRSLAEESSGSIPLLSSHMLLTSIFMTTLAWLRQDFTFGQLS